MASFLTNLYLDVQIINTNYFSYKSNDNNMLYVYLLSLLFKYK